MVSLGFSHFWNTLQTGHIIKLNHPYVFLRYRQALIPAFLKAVQPLWCKCKNKITLCFLSPSFFLRHHSPLWQKCCLSKSIWLCREAQAQLRDSIIQSASAYPATLLKPATSSGPPPPRGCLIVPQCYLHASSSSVKEGWKPIWSLELFKVAKCHNFWCYLCAAFSLGFFW